MWKARCRLATPRHPEALVRACHGGPQGWLGGPATKLNRMDEFFPDEPYAFNILYSVNAMYPARICRWAQHRGVKVVCHINSMNHAAYAPDFEGLNRPAAEVLSIADHVVFGSVHAREAARKYLGETRAPHTIVYNGVDTNQFRPVPSPSEGRFAVLAAGVHTLRHRLEPLIRAMPLVLKSHPDAELLIAGPLKPGDGIFDCGQDSISRIIAEVGLNRVRLLGEYSQTDAPSIYVQADVLVHLKHMDWTPNTVIEAMACGLPIVHPGNGGLPEIEADAGVFLGLPNDWDRIHTAEPALLAEKIIEAYERRKELGEAARRRAVEMFDIRRWVEAHRRIFEELLNSTVAIF